MKYGSVACVVSTSASDCLERLVSEMTCYVSSGRKTPLTHSSHSSENTSRLVEDGMTSHYVM